MLWPKAVLLLTGGRRHAHSTATSSCCNRIPSCRQRQLEAPFPPLTGWSLAAQPRCCYCCSCAPRRSLHHQLRARCRGRGHSFIRVLAPVSAQPIPSFSLRTAKPMARPHSSPARAPAPVHTAPHRSRLRADGCSVDAFLPNSRFCVRLFALAVLAPTSAPALRYWRPHSRGFTGLHAFFTRP